METTTETATLAVEGMTCASCVARVERALGRVEGVIEANVNLATERATVRFDPQATAPDALAAAVIRAGYAAHPEAIERADAKDRKIAALRRRVLVAVALTVPIWLLEM